MMKFQTLLLCLFLIGEAYSLTCSPGTYYSSMMNKCYSCKKGQYQDQAGQTYCKICKWGEYTIQVGQSKCNACPIGHSCYYRDMAPVKCPKGRYQDQIGQPSCKWCNGGEYNLQIGRSKKCDKCPLGHRCYHVDWPPVTCSKGQYQDQLGQKFCKYCNGGEYNIQTGRSTKCDKCPVGHRCYHTFSAPIKCSKGQYQDKQGQRFCEWCARGEYTLQIGQSKCEKCPVGHRCYYRDVPPIKCSKGKYQDLSGQTSCKWCNNGEYTIQVGQSKCDICPVGHYCKYVDTAPVKCPKGEYQDKKGQRSCIWCKGGEYNLQIGRSTKCDICPVGHRCYYIDTAPVKCRKGKYQDQPGQRSCKWCKAGQYTLQTGSTKCKSCPAGSACPYVDTPPVPCSQGSYSPSESTKCYSCPSGSFCPSPSSSPVTPNNDTVIKSEVKKVVSYAAEAYQNKNDPTSELTDSNNKVHGFVRYKGNAIVVAFRGTTGISSWINNAKYLRTTYQSCQGCEIHTGFSNSYNSVQKQMMTKVNALSQAHPNSKVIVTGHSLGGALATLAAVDLAKAGYNTDLITYGSPRVGNKKFSEYADKNLKSTNLRVTYKDDIVTVVPPQSIGYWHVGQEMHYTDQTTAYKLPPKTDVNYIRMSFGDHKLENYEKLN